MKIEINKEVPVVSIGDLFVVDYKNRGKVTMLIGCDSKLIFLLDLEYGEIKYSIDISRDTSELISHYFSCTDDHNGTYFFIKKEDYTLSTKLTFGESNI